MKKWLLSFLALFLYSSGVGALPWNNLKSFPLSKNAELELQISPNLIQKTIFDPSKNSEGQYFKNSDQPHPILICKLNENDPTLYQIEYDSGPSDDPTFLIKRFEKDGSLSELLSIQALKLFITGNNAFYSEGHTNNLFNKRRKFQVVNSIVQEVKQPFYYVGIRGKLFKNFTIYADTTLKQAVAILPANSQVEVLLAEYTNDYNPKLLLKSDFGLTGWIVVEGSQFEGSSEDGGSFGNGIQGIYFAGD